MTVYEFLSEYVDLGDIIRVHDSWSRFSITATCYEFTRTEDYKDKKIKNVTSVMYNLNSTQVPILLIVF